ncbi:MAG: UvrD-helicase domain-containing protein, partial [Caulobacteraceae bacterium]
MTPPNPQIIASDPEVSAFVTANAGSGKTRTLVDRVARLLLRGARPQAILCVTFTKAAAAEMQRRLFAKLGAWAVMPDAELAKALAEIDETPDDLPNARRLFARALETPGGLKIQTIHAFCEALLRRFPLEAGVSPAFKVVDDQAGRDLSAEAQREVALAAEADAAGPLGQAYGRLAADLDFRTFTGMFATFEGQRRELADYFRNYDVEADIWSRCGFAEPSSVEAVDTAAMAGFDWDQLLVAGRALLEGSAAKDAPLGERMLALCERHKGGSPSSFSDLWALFCTQAGKPLSKIGTQAIDAGVRDWLAEQQALLGEACEQRKAAVVAEDTVAALTLAAAYIGIYEALKGRLGGLDFGDLIERVRDLLTERSDAAWVLFKLDGGLDHILLDEAQDTSPGQWAIVDALAEEFFAGAGVRPALKRTAFAVGDEKQSIFSFQGARPELFIGKRQQYETLVDGSGSDFTAPDLITSYRSAPEVLDFVDAVFADRDALRGLRPDSAMEGELVRHIASRAPGFGGVEIWPLESSDKAEEQDVWAPLDTPAPDSANKKLARAIAAHIKAVIARGDAVYVDENTTRPAGPQDFMILVRRRNALFHEIIRALKKAGVAVGGADRL